jgi:type I restriction enzyme R subunit
MPTGIIDNDVPAKQFNLLVLNAQLSLLKREEGFESYRQRIMEATEALESLPTFPWWRLS